MANTPVMEDAELVAFATNPVIIKFDNNQLEIIYDPQHEPEALAVAQQSILNTVIANELGNIHFTQDQGGATLFVRSALKTYFNNLGLIGVTNDV